jgi:arsenate reductase
MSLFHLLKQRRARVLFVCKGNTFRSRMAEGFAKAKGADLIDAFSAGMIPGNTPSRTVQRLMLERGVELTPDIPRRLTEAEMARYDLVVNLTDSPLPASRVRVLSLPVSDPVRKTPDEQRDIRDRIEHLIDMLIAQFRQAREEWIWDIPENQPDPVAAVPAGAPAPMRKWASTAR